MVNVEDEEKEGKGRVASSVFLAWMSGQKRALTEIRYPGGGEGALEKGRSGKVQLEEPMSIKIKVLDISGIQEIIHAMMV